jgi:F-type H+-transporting ATPase subunit gamma
VICIGRKVRDFLRRRYPTAVAGEERAGRVQIVGEHVNVLSRLKFENVSEIAENIIDRYTRCEIDAVYLLYNEFKSVIAQRLVIDQMLPVKEIGVRDIRDVVELTEEERQRLAEAAETAGVSVHGADTTEIDQRATQFATAQVDYIYEQSPDELFRALLPKYITGEVFRSMLESWAAFNAAQMTAMDSATNNASDMIDSLTLAMNRVRQAKITKEIIEIVSGAAAQG